LYSRSFNRSASFRLPDSNWELKNKDFSSICVIASSSSGGFSVEAEKSGVVRLRSIDFFMNFKMCASATIKITGLTSLGYLLGLLGFLVVIFGEHVIRLLLHF